ncbi:hypothetical protein GCK72_013040 [Caenorhabditis remanei]|uniref:Uncharacterized protein n=1 Tax=Caenorhabditis remanei TaxID=31234 RepID=A0A6A5GMP6_CAERE|nr:hypothetical protein GCK72_013040 [Caenorhabditis remanei]KAF1756587.1 hypothetical protein GCK72_013040 [Caenorhabditis remanei]
MDEGIDWDCCFLLMPHIGLERSEKTKENNTHDFLLEKNEGRKQLGTKPRQFEKPIPDPRGSIHREDGNAFCGRTYCSYIALIFMKEH